MVNSRSKAMMAGAAAVLILSLAASAFAQAPRRGPAGPGPGGRPGGPGMGMGPMGMGPGGLPLGQLDLSESQLQQVREIAQKYQPELREAMGKVADAREAQRKAIETVPVNEGLVRAVTETLNNAELEVALIQAHVYNHTYSILTAEQQTKLKELQARRDTRTDRRPRARPKA